MAKTSRTAVPRAKKKTATKTAPPSIARKRPKKATAVELADWRVQFVAALRSTGNVAAAAAEARISRAQVYRERQQNRDFAEAWASALEVAVADLEIEARRRACEGNDRLLMFLLKAHQPSVYGDRAAAGTSPGQVTADDRLVARRIVADPIAARLAAELLERLARADESGGAGDGGEPREMEAGAASESLES